MANSKPRSKSQGTFRLNRADMQFLSARAREQDRTVTAQASRILREWINSERGPVLVELPQRSLIDHIPESREGGTDE